MATALIGLGSNLGDRAAALHRAVNLLKAEPNIRVSSVSSVRTSKPAGGPPGQGEFLNAAVRLETKLPPKELLKKLLRIEKEVGRVREERWGPRVVDIDLLLYDRVQCKSDVLELPHPRMSFRRFVLEPAADVAPNMIHPGSGATIRTLLEHLNERPRYIALGGLNIWGRHAALDALEQQSSVIPIRTAFPHESFRTDPGKAEQVLSQVLVDETDILAKIAVLDVFHRPLDVIATAPSKKWCISDYWFEQLLADFSFYSPKMIVGTLYPFNNSPILPRLLVVDDAVEVAESHHEGFVRYNEYMHSLVAHHKIAVLRLDSESDAVAEVLAAMQAME